MRPSSESLTTASAEQTEALGARLASELGPGAVVLLSGEVGAGKTTLVRGALRALGHEGRVTSPTFTLARRYEDGRVPVSHLDLHRLGGSLADEDPALLADEFGPGRITFVEWPEALDAEALGPVARRVVLRHAGGDRRDVEIAPG